MLDPSHWMNEEKQHSQQLLALFQLSKRQICQTTIFIVEYLHLVTVQASDGRTAHLAYSPQYTDGGYQIGFIIH